MKKIFLLLILFMPRTLDAQINYENSYPFVQSQCQSRLQLINIGNDDFKYIYFCYSTNQLNILNLDHTNFLTITPPINLLNDGEYSISYVTKSLFDCDSTMIEYAILPMIPRNTFYIYRQDGTLLFQRDSTIATYGFGAFSGSYDVRPIVNTPNGAKLFLAKLANGGFPTVDVYSLCGNLPMQIEMNQNNLSVLISPNPASRNIRFNFSYPGNLDNYELNIMNTKSQIITKKILSSFDTTFDLNCENFIAGTYCYFIKFEDRIIQSGKFNIIK